MKKRIYRSMSILAGGTLFLSAILMFMILNGVTHDQFRLQIDNEAGFVAEALNAFDSEDEKRAYLNSLEVDGGSRVTRIGANGEVPFDSYTKARDMENHMDRKEVLDAFEKGEGSAERLSATISKMTYYHAILLDDGSVIRLSFMSKSLFALAAGALPMIVILFIGVLIAALSLAGKMTASIVKPINNLNIQEPEKNFVYEELSPLLERIQKQNSEQKKNEQMRREFSANVSHELKTPLTSISGYAELIQNGMVKAEDIPAFAGKITKESARLLALIEDTIKISRLDEKRIMIDKERINLLEVAKDVRERLLPLAAKNRIDIRVTGEPVYRMAVEQMIDELMYNVCENAMKYNKPGGKVVIHISKSGEKGKITVTDTGIGIPKAHQERIFERFYRVDKSHSRQTGGTGLGLAIVKHVVEYHDGTIQLDSEEGHGTVMTVVI